MKREFLKGLTFKVGEQDVTLPEEVINNIIAENGKDIEGTKTKLNGQIENLNSELKTTKETLDQANVQIENFKGLDIEGTKKAAEEWKTKYEQFEANSKTEKEAYEQKLKDQAYDFTLKDAVSNLKFPNEITRNAFMNELKAKKLPLEGEKLLGFEDYIKEVGEKNPGLFVTEVQQTNEPQVQFAAATSQNQVPNKGVSLLDAMKAGNAGQSVDISQVGKFGMQQQ